jgi:hypothetical protein
MDVRIGGWPRGRCSVRVATYEGFVEHGQVRLIGDVQLPEKIRVYVVIPEMEMRPTGYIASPRLAHPEQARDFEKQVFEDSNAGL